MSGRGAADLRPPSRAALAQLAATALDEDLGGDPGRDVTTEAVVPVEARAVVAVRARTTGVVAGSVIWQPLLADAARRLGQPPPRVETVLPDGSAVGAGQVVVRLRGAVRTLLVAERSGLNFASRASGIATATRAWVTAVSGTSAGILDTRKTAPGLRVWDKYAVRCGGGSSKRIGLHDVAMVKDNHVAAAGSVAAAYRAVRERFPEVAVEVEVESVAQALAAVAAGARYLLCDNLATPELARLVAAVRALPAGAGDQVALEATGGLRLDRAAEVAATGVDFLSVGALTHSAVALDLGLDWGG